MSRVYSFRKQCWEADKFLKSELIKVEENIDLGEEQTDENINMPVINDMSLRNEDVEINDDIIYDVSYEKAVENENDDMNICDAQNLLDNVDEYYTSDSFKLEHDLIAITNDIEEGNITKENEINSEQNTKESNLPIESKLNPKIFKTRKRKTKNDDQLDEINLLCPTCGKAYHNKDSFYYHINQSHNPNRKEELSEKIKGEFKCEDCDMSFINSIAFNRHIKIHNPNNPNLCNVCNKRFPNRTSLEMHMRSHDKVKPLHCEICGQGAIHQNALKTHMRFHTGDRPWKCNTCDATFFSSSHLRSHETLHSNLTYTCDVCNKVYKSLRSFQKHKKIHNPKQWYNCEFCDEKFSDTRRRNNHLQKHDEYKPVICPVCGKSIIHLAQLDIHMRIKHSIAEYVEEDSE